MQMIDFTSIASIFGGRVRRVWKNYESLRVLYRGEPAGDYDKLEPNWMCN